MPTPFSPAFYPDFDQIQLDTVLSELETLLNEGRQVVADITQASPATWESIVQPLNAFDLRLDKFWSPISHLNGVKNSQALREIYETGSQAITAFHTEIGQNKALYNQYLALKNHADFANMRASQQRTITNAILHFHLAGVDLDTEAQAKFQTHQQKLIQLCNQFANHVLDATHHWFYHTEDADDLVGLPEHVLKQAQSQAQAHEQTGFRLGIDEPTYVEVVTHADNRELRKQFYEAYVTRASDQGPDAGKWDNSELMQTILQERQALADLLGYPNYVHCSLADKMADSPETVERFLLDLAQQARPFAEQEWQTLQAFAAKKGCHDIQSWDVAYYSEKLRQEKYQLSQQTLRQYFPIETVLSGMFRLVEHLFDIQVKPHSGTYTTWAPEVMLYDVLNPQKEVIASFYVDCYARKDKRSGAWMDHCTTHCQWSNGSIERPLAYLNCNFTPPQGDTPSLLTHDEVVTLFHEFGHVLHHILSTVPDYDVSGVNGVAWDAVELPSQFLENFAWQQEVMPWISQHYQTGDALPDSLFHSLKRTFSFQAGMQMLRQVEFSLFDLRIHQHPDQPVQDILDAVREEVAIVTPPRFNRFQHGFNHIFAGGYAAGYYSYKWAEVLSADAFSAFQEQGVLDIKTGQLFKSCILNQGGAQDMSILFAAFRGRSPTVDALVATLQDEGTG